MGDQNGPRAWANGALQTLEIDRQVFGIQIYWHGHQAMRFDDSHHVANGDRRNEHFAPLGQLERLQPKIEAGSYGETSQGIIMRRPVVLEVFRQRVPIPTSQAIAQGTAQIRPADV